VSTRQGPGSTPMRRMDPGSESRGVHEQVVPAPDADLGEQDRAIEDVPGSVLNELEADGWDEFANDAR
jgi:hypothetical protein